MQTYYVIRHASKFVVVNYEPQAASRIDGGPFLTLAGAHQYAQARTLELRRDRMTAFAMTCALLVLTIFAFTLAAVGE